MGKCYCVSSNTFRFSISCSDCVNSCRLWSCYIDSSNSFTYIISTLNRCCINSIIITSVFHTIHCKLNSTSASKTFYRTNYISSCYNIRCSINCIRFCVVTIRLDISCSENIVSRSQRFKFTIRIDWRIVTWRAWNYLVTYRSWNTRFYSGNIYMATRRSCRTIITAISNSYIGDLI